MDVLKINALNIDVYGEVLWPVVVSTKITLGILNEKRRTELIITLNKQIMRCTKINQSDNLHIHKYILS